MRQVLACLLVSGCLRCLEISTRTFSNIMPGRWLISCLYLVCTLCHSQLLAGPVYSTGGGSGLAEDLFDMAAGAQVIWSSPQNSCCGESDPRSIFGYLNPDGFIEHGVAIFEDGAPAGTVDVIEFQTAAPINLRTIALRLSQDGGSAYRGASSFRFLGSADGLTFSRLSGGTIPTGANGNLNVPLLITDSSLANSPTNMRAFRLELTRATSGGIRVIEFDGSGTAVSATNAFLNRLAFNAVRNQLTGRGSMPLDDEGPGLATDFIVSSRLHNQDTPEDAFGGNHGTVEPDTFIFADAGAPDNGNLILGDGGETVDFLEWRVAASLPLAGYRLSVRGEGTFPGRDTALVRFLIDGIEVDRFHNQGFDGDVLRTFDNGVVEGSHFRLELTRTSASGPRIVEIDALTGPLPPLNAGIRINEAVSQNSNTLKDEDGDSPDWIEIFNASEHSVNLSGWGLTDRAAAPFKWVFPSVSLPPRGYLVVFASGKNRTTHRSRLHTNFQLAQEGEAVTLSKSDGTPVDWAPIARLRRDISYGRQPDGVGEWKFFVEPTPLASNARQSYSGLVFEAPTFSVPAGFYTNPISVFASSREPGVTLHYTLDGSDPTELSPVLHGPLTLVSRSGQPNLLSMIPGTSTANQHTDGWKPPLGEVRKATVLRVRALRSDAIPGPVATHTYFIGSDAVRTDALPVMSITTPTNGLFDHNQGIYMLGAVFEQYLATHAGEPLTGHTPANYTQRGDAWERLAHVEYFEPGGAFAFEEPAALDIQGQSSRSFRQKSFGLKARGEDDRVFTYPFFPGLTKLGDGSPLTSFRHLRLRNCGNDWDYALMRDDWCHRLAAGLGLDLMSSRTVNIYLGGEYWGILRVREQQDPLYLAAHYGLPESEVVILHGEGALEEGKPGDEEAFRSLRNYAETHDLSVPAYYEYVRRRLDVENFLMYQLAEIYFANADWPQNNMRVWRRRLSNPDFSQPVGHDGRWRWFMFDVDLGVSHPWAAGVTENTLAVALSPTGRNGFNTPWATAFLRALIRNPGFKTNFLTTAADLLNSHFSSRNAVNLVDAMEAELLPAMNEHIRRWRGNGGSVLQWRDRVRVVRSFAQQRPSYLRSHFSTLFGLGGSVQLTVKASEVGAGIIRVNRLSINPQLPGANSSAPYPWVGMYFKGIPLTLEAVPAPGYQFVRWSGIANSPATPWITITPSTNLTVLAEFVSLAPEIVGSKQLDGTTLQVEFNGAPGAGYTLQTSANLASWTDVSSASTSTNGNGTVNLTIDRVEPARFFRLRSNTW